MGPAGPTNTDTVVSPISCPNEDINLNGVIDPGEDANGDGILQPGNPAEVVPVPPATSITLDSNGQAQFYVQYPQDHANWVAVRLLAQATVSGTQTTEYTDFALQALATDIKTQTPAPPGFVSPYGTVQDCTNKN